MRNKSSKKFIRFSAAVTLAVFFINSIAFGQTLPNFQTVSLQNLISLPEQFGDIDSSVSNKFKVSPEHPVLIHLQDAHSNYSAQVNSAKILDFLIREQNIDLVFVEGAAGNLDAKNLHFAEDEELNDRIADRLARMGELTGSDLFLLKYKTGAKFVGIENAPLYRREIEYLKKVFRSAEKINSYLTDKEKSLERDLSRIANRDLLTALRVYLRLEKKTKSMMAEIAVLERLSRRHLGPDFLTYKNQKDFSNLLRLIHLREEESKLNHEKINAEIAAIETAFGFKNLKESLKNTKTEPRFVLENFYASLRGKGFEFSKYPNFTRYARSLIFERELAAEGLFSEIENLLARLFAVTSNTEEEKQAVRTVRDFKLFSKLMTLELTRKEWESVRNRELVHQVIASEFIPVDDAVNFYRFAEERESAFYQIIEETLKKKKSDRAIVITGGFHAEALKKHFSGKASALMVATPKINELSRENYVKTLLGRSPSDIEDSEAPGVPYAVPAGIAASLGVDVKQRSALINAVGAQERARLESASEAASLGTLKKLTSMDAPYTDLPIRALQMMDKEAVPVTEGRFTRMVTPEREPGTSFAYNYVGQKIILDIREQERLDASNFRIMHLDSKTPFLNALFEESRKELKESGEYLAFYDPVFDGGVFAIGKKREVINPGGKRTIYLDLVFPFVSNLRHFEYIRVNYRNALKSHGYRTNLKLDMTIAPSEVSFPRPEIVKVGAVPQEALLLKPAGMKMIRRLALPIEQGVKIDGNKTGPEIAILPVASDRMEAQDRNDFIELMRASRFTGESEKFVFLGVAQGGVFAITPVKDPKDEFARSVFSFISLGNEGGESAEKFLGRGGLSFLFSANGLEPKDLNDPAIQTVSPRDVMMTVVPHESVEGIPTWVELQAVQIEGQSLGSGEGATATEEASVPQEQQWISPKGLRIEMDEEALLRIGGEKENINDQLLVYVHKGKVALLKSTVQEDAVAFSTTDLTQHERDTGIETMRYAVSSWDDLGKYVPLRQPLGKEEGTFGEAFYLNLRVTEKMSPAIRNVLGNPPDGVVRRLYVKMSKPGTNWREDRYNIINKEPYMRERMAVTHKVETNEELVELGLQAFKGREIYIQGPVVVLSGVIQEMIQRKLEMRAERLLLQFADSVFSGWKGERKGGEKGKGIVDSDSKLNNWGINQAGRQVFHDFDFTMPREEFERYATVKDVPDFDTLLNLYFLNNKIYDILFGDLTTLYSETLGWGQEAVQKKAKALLASNISRADLDQLRGFGFFAAISDKQIEELYALSAQQELTASQLEEVKNLSLQEGLTREQANNSAALLRLRKMTDMQMVLWWDQFMNRVVGAFVNFLANNYDILVNGIPGLEEQLELTLVKKFMEKAQEMPVLAEILKEATRQEPDSDFRKLVTKIKSRGAREWVIPNFRFLFNTVRNLRFELAKKLREIPEIEEGSEQDPEFYQSLWQEQNVAPYENYDEMDERYQELKRSFQGDWDDYNLNYGVFDEIDTLGVKPVSDSAEQLSELKHIVVGSDVPAYGLKITNPAMKPLHLVVVRDRDQKGEFLRIIDVTAVQTKGKVSGTEILHHDDRGAIPVFKEGEQRVTVELPNGKSKEVLKTISWPIEGKAILNIENQKSGRTISSAPVTGRVSTVKQVGDTMLLGGKELKKPDNPVPAGTKIAQIGDTSFVKQGQEPPKVGRSGQVSLKQIGKTGQLLAQDLKRKKELPVQAHVPPQPPVPANLPAVEPGHVDVDDILARAKQMKTGEVTTEAPKPEAPKKPSDRVQKVEPAVTPGVLIPGTERKASGRIPRPQKPANPNGPKPDTRSIPKGATPASGSLSDSKKVVRPQKSPPERMNWEGVKNRLQSIMGRLKNTSNGAERLISFGNAVEQWNKMIREKGLENNQFLYSANAQRIFMMHVEPILTASAQEEIFERGFMIERVKEEEKEIDVVSVLHGVKRNTPQGLQWKKIVREDGGWTFANDPSASGSGSSLGKRNDSDEVIIEVALKGTNRLLAPGDVKHTNRLAHLLEAEKPVISGPRVDMPLEYVLARLGINPTQISKRRAMVVTQELAENKDIRQAILENISKVYIPRESFSDPAPYYDQFIKEAREARLRGIKVDSILSAAGIRPEDLERKLRKYPESFSVEDVQGRVSIPAINKKHFPRFKIDEDTVSRGNVSMKLTMEIIMALALVDDPNVYKVAGFKKQAGDSFWHVDNSFVEFIQSLFQEYQADQTQKQAA